MGTEAFWIPAALTALSAGTTYVTQKRAADKQDDIAAQGIRQQGRHQADMDARINEELSSLQESNPDAERQASLDGFLSQLRAARSQSNGGGGNVSGASERYKGDVETSQAAIGNYGTQRAGTLSRLNGATLQRQNEGLNIGRMNVDLGGLQRDAGASDFLTRLRANGVTPNPWGIAAGQLLAGAASGASSHYSNAAAAGDELQQTMSRTGMDPVTGKISKNVTGPYGTGRAWGP